VVNRRASLKTLTPHVNYQGKGGERIAVMGKRSSWKDLSMVRSLRNA